MKSPKIDTSAQEEEQKRAKAERAKAAQRNLRNQTLDLRSVYGVLSGRRGGDRVGTSMFKMSGGDRG